VPATNIVSAKNNAADFMADSGIIGKAVCR
jgi:hypothetical protein